MNVVPPLTLLTLVPLVGALIVIGLSGQMQRHARCVSLAFSFLALALTLVLWRHFHSASGELQFEENLVWIPTLGVNYHLGIDGLGLLMLLLSAIVVPMAALHIASAVMPMLASTSSATRRRRLISREMFNTSSA